MRTTAITAALSVALLFGCADHHNPNAYDPVAAGEFEPLAVTRPADLAFDEEAAAAFAEAHDLPVACSGRWDWADSIVPFLCPPDGEWEARCHPSILDRHPGAIASRGCGWPDGIYGVEPADSTCALTLDERGFATEKVSAHAAVLCYPID